MRNTEGGLDSAYNGSFANVEIAIFDLQSGQNFTGMRQLLR